MNIRLLNIHHMEEHEKDKPYNVVIMRGTPLGNPYNMRDKEYRNEVCDQYEIWFERQLFRKNPIVAAELQRLMDIHDEWGKLRLVCCCTPLRCHGETIMRHLNRLGKNTWSRLF